MKKYIALVLGLLAFVALGITPTDSTAISFAASDARPKNASTTDYGSGLWGGPVSGSYVQDAGWASTTLKVGMVGDSITYRCAPDLRAAFAAQGISFAIRAWSGQNTEGSLDWYQSLSNKPDWTLFETGTNDIFAPPAMAGQLARAKTLAGPNLLWMDTVGARTAYPVAVQLSDARNVGWVNAQIHEAIPASHIVNWNAAIGNARGRGILENFYIQDGFHPWVSASSTPPAHGDGCAFLAATVINEVLPLL